MNNKEQFYKPREVATIDEKEMVIVHVPLFIPKIMVDNGAVETFAREKTGWTPTIKVEHKDEDGNLVYDEVGNVVMETIDNPVTAERAGITLIQRMVRSEYKGVMLLDAEKKGRAQAEAQFNALFGE